MSVTKEYYTTEHFDFPNYTGDVTVFGVVHSEVDSNRLYESMDEYEFDALLYEEHIKNGFDRGAVSEHEAIHLYCSGRDVKHRSMDIPTNRESVKSLDELFPKNPPKMSLEQCKTKAGIKKYQQEFIEDRPLTYLACLVVRNCCMYKEILSELKSGNNVGAVVGMAHLYGHCSLEQLLNPRSCTNLS